VRHLTIAEVVDLHRRVIALSGGSYGLRDPAALESAIGQPLQTHLGKDLYPRVIDKAAALAFFLCRNHAFVDGNKRVAHAALEVTLVLNGLDLTASVDEQETTMLRLASGSLSREEFTRWVEQRVVENGG